MFFVTLRRSILSLLLDTTGEATVPHAEHCLLTRNLVFPSQAGDHILSQLSRVRVSSEPLPAEISSSEMDEVRINLCPMKIYFHLSTALTYSFGP